MSLIASDETDYDFMLEVPEIDAALLMELLEEDDDHIEHESERCEDCEIDHEMMADFDIHACSESSSTTYLLAIDDVSFDWDEMNEMGCEFANGEDMRYEDDQGVDCDGDQWWMDQQLYIPLWQ